MLLYTEEYESMLISEACDYLFGCNEDFWPENECSISERELSRLRKEINYGR